MVLSAKNEAVPNSLMVSVDVKHHVYLLKNESRTTPPPHLNLEQVLWLFFLVLRLLPGIILCYFLQSWFIQPYLKESGKLLRDGVEHIWAFPSAQIPP